MTVDQATIPVHRETKDRIEDMKPFYSMSWDEFIREMAEQYEPPKAAAGGD